MATESQQTIQSIKIKQDDGTLEDQSYFAVDSSRVYYEDATVGKIDIEKILDNYMDYMKTGWFVYKGSVEPTNKRIGIWIDTRPLD